jgi:predicted nucleic acid-binding protein
MPAVSDTSPILGLAAIGYLSLLEEQFGEVFIPQAVLTELKIDSNFKGTSEISRVLSDGWLKVTEVQNKPLAQSLLMDLHQGEAEAIALAIDLHIHLLVMDEKIGRERARDLGLKTVGILGVLLSAKKNGRIISLGDAMTALRNEVGFFISDDLYRQLLGRAGE